MGITEILRRILLLSASKQPDQLIVELNSSLQYIIVTLVFTVFTRYTGFLLLTLSVIDHTQVTILTQSKLATYSVIFSWCACRWSELSLYKTTKQGKERKST